LYHHHHGDDDEESNTIYSGVVEMMSDDDSDNEVSLNPLSGPIVTGSSDLSEAEWGKVIENSQVSKGLINSLILQYFDIGSFKDAAVEFMRESFVEPDVDMNSLHERECIRSKIVDGDFLGAMELVNCISPAILQDNQRLLFDLYQQHFVGILLSGNAQEAIAFAKSNLAPLVLQNPLLLKDIEHIMSLVIYTDITKDCPAHLRGVIDKSRKYDLADSVNRAVLEHEGHPVEPELMGMLRQLVNTQNEIARKGTSKFPTISGIDM
jgi:glucose-induced degradation protein 8